MKTPTCLHSVSVRERERAAPEREKRSGEEGRGERRGGERRGEEGWSG